MGVRLGYLAESHTWYLMHTISQISPDPKQDELIKPTNDNNHTIALPLFPLLTHKLEINNCVLAFI